MKASSIVLAGVVLVLAGCSKGYVIHTEVDNQGNKQKVVSTSAVDNSNWHWLFGSDITIQYPMNCPYSAIGWNGDLDKEQCTIEHEHEKGMTRYHRTVHANDTIIKKAVTGLWALLFFIPRGGSATATQTNTNNAAFYDNIPPSGGHAVVR